ncbi:putative centrosomal protein CEP162 [Plasmopara halstedii]
MSESDSDGEFERLLHKAEDSHLHKPAKRNFKPAGADTSSSASAVAAATAGPLVSSELSKFFKTESKSKTKSSVKKKNGKKSYRKQLSDYEEEPPGYYDNYSTRPGGERENFGTDPYAFDISLQVVSGNATENHDFKRSSNANKKKKKNDQSDNYAIKAVTKRAVISMDDRIAEILKRTGSSQWQASEKSDDDESNDTNIEEKNVAASAKIDTNLPRIDHANQEDDSYGIKDICNEQDRSSSSDSLGVVSADFLVHIPMKPKVEQPRLSISSLDSGQFAINRDALISEIRTPSRYEQQEMTFLKSEVVENSNSEKVDAQKSQLNLSKSDTFGYDDEDFEVSDDTKPKSPSTKIKGQVETTAQDEVETTQDANYGDSFCDDAYEPAQDEAQKAQNLDHCGNFKGDTISSTQDGKHVTPNTDDSDNYQEDVFEEESEAGNKASINVSSESVQVIEVETQNLPAATDLLVGMDSKNSDLLASYGISSTQLNGAEVGEKGPSHELMLETQDAFENSLANPTVTEKFMTVHPTAVTTATCSSRDVISLTSSLPPPPPPLDDIEDDNQEIQKFTLCTSVVDSKQSIRPVAQQSATVIEKSYRLPSAADKFLQIENQVASLRFVSPIPPSLEALTSPLSGRVHPVEFKVAGGYRNMDVADFPSPIFEPLSHSFNADLTAENEDIQREIDEFVRTSVNVREKRDAERRIKTARENGLLLRLQQAQRHILQLKRYIKATTANAASNERTASTVTDAEVEGIKMYSLPHSSQAAFEKLQKEIKTQDNLIAAFQKENERLMQQLKQVQGDCRYNIHEANEDLRRQVAKLQKQLGELATLDRGSDFTSKKYQYRAAVEGRLAAEAHALSLQEELAGLRLSHQQKFNELTLELDRVKKAKIELECRYEGIALTEVAEEAQHAGELQKELEFVKKEHFQALAVLQKKLDWYVENQRLLDDQDDELRQLRRQVAARSRDSIAPANNKASEPSPSLSHRRSPMDIRRIQELESRLAEVEGAMRRRHPDSLTNLILATRRADEESKIRCLEQEYQDKIVALSHEIEQEHEISEKKLVSFRQQQEKLLLQYKRKLTEQEKQLKQLRKATMGYGLTSKNTARARTSDAELAKIRQFYTDKIKELERKWEAKYRSLRKQQIKSNQQVKIPKHADSAALITNLQWQLHEQESLIKDERARVKQLEAERQLGYSSVDNSPAKEDRKYKPELVDQIDDLKKQLEDSENARARLAHSLTAVQTFNLGREPKSETDKTHIVLNSPSKLKNADKQKEAELMQMKQDLDAAREARNSEHASASHTINQLEKQVIELTGKTTALEVQLAGSQREVQSFEKLLHEAEKSNHCLTTQVQRIPNLEKEVLALRNELKLPRTPSLVQYRSLDLKIATLEQKYKLREAELQVVIDRTLTSTHLEQLSCERAHRAAIHAKNDEIALFKRQLDEILHEIAQLQEPTLARSTSVSSDPPNMRKT